MTRAFSTAWKQIRRTPYQAIGAILVLFITFFVGYAFSLLSYTSNQVLQYFETRPQVTAFFKQNATSEEIAVIQEEIRTKPYVSQVKVVSKNEALSLYKEENKQDPLLLELVTADILPASIEVNGKDIGALDQIQQDLSQYKDKIDEVVYQKNIVDALAKWTSAIRGIGIGVMAVLVVTSCVVTMIIISMKVAMKRQEIGIMRLLGATSWYINGPVLVEGMTYGVLSAVFAWLFAFVGVLYATPFIIEFFGEVPVLPIPWQFYGVQAAVGIGVGAFIGLLSSTLALRRFIK